MENQIERSKPQPVTTAVNLVWGSMVLGLLSMMFSPFLNLKAQALVFAFVGLAVTVAIIAFLLRKISAGKNWARVTYLVFFVLGTPTTVLSLPTVLSVAPIYGMLTLIGVGLQGYALYLLFTQPGGAWFRKEVAA